MFLIIAYTYLLLCQVYGGLYYRDKEFNYIGSPFKLKKPKTFIKRFLICYNRNLGMVNVYFYLEMIAHTMVLVSPLWFLMIYLNNWHLNRMFISGYAVIWLISICFIFIIPTIIVEMINHHATKEYIKNHPEQENKRKKKSVKWTWKDEQSLKDLDWIVSLSQDLKKHCHFKKGVLYLSLKDIERIKTYELVKYKKAYHKLVYDKKGKPIFTVYDKRNNDVLFQAPIKE